MWEGADSPFLYREAKAELIIVVTVDAAQDFSTAWWILFLKY